MSERSEFLTAIRDNPDDPAPRLAFADWLVKSAARQRGEKREAILAQAEVLRWYAKLPPGAEESEHEGHRRICSHCCKYEEAWLRYVPLFARNWVFFQNGLPTELTLRAAQLLEHGARLRAEVPFTKLCLDEAEGHLDEILRAGLLRGIRSLRLNRTDQQDDELIRLFRSPDLASLRSLSLGGGSLGDEAAAALATSEPLSGLTELSAFCGPSVGRALADRGCTLTNLQELTCGDAGLDSSDVAALVLAPVADELVELSLWGSSLDGSAGAAIADSARLAKLRRLELNECGLDDDGLVALSSAQYLHSLEVLGMRENRITAVGTAALGRSQLAASLKSLDLGTNSLGDEAIVALFDDSAFRRLEELGLGGLGDARNNVGARGIAELVRSRVPATLRKLGFYQNDQLGPDGAKSLAACPAFPRLEEICLTHCKVGPEGVIALARSHAFTALRRLELKDNELDSTAATAIAGAPWAATLERLELDDNPNIGPDGARALAACANFTHLESLGLSNCNRVLRPG